MKLDTPFLWFTQTVNGVPRPWQFFKIDGLMLNAYEILKNEPLNNKVREKGVHEYFNFEGLIAIDSGGFLFMKKGVLDVSPEMVLKLYEESKPNFGVTLDYPLSPGLSYKVMKQRRLMTLENIRHMLQLKQSDNPELIPVIHGYSSNSIKWYLRQLEHIGTFNIYGIGSLVPSVFNTKDAGGIYNVVKIVRLIRKSLPNKIIHVFGVGSTLTMHIMFLAGADSIDSSSWRTKAAFGAIQLPGIGDRYITPNKRHQKYTQLKNHEIKILEECECPACKKSSFEELKKSFTLRALHNAWVFQKEIEKTRKLVKDNKYEEYATNVIRKTKYSKIINFLK
ncbi:MAG: tRNA-guanine transglycosylase [Candidatus Aenigmatarchaeota archaeon]